MKNAIWWAALAVCVPIGMAMGALIDHFLVRPLRERSASTVSLVSLVPAAVASNFRVWLFCIGPDDKTSIRTLRLWRTFCAAASMNARCTASAAMKRSSRFRCRLSGIQGAARFEASWPRAKN